MSKKTIKELMAEIKALFQDDEPAPPASNQFMTATLKDGTIVKWDGELTDGVAIMVESPDGDIAAPDATHELEDGTLITTVNGLVTEIVPVTPVNEVVEDQSAAVVEMMSQLTQRVEQLSEIVSKFESQLQSKDAEIAKLKDTFSKTVELVELVANFPQQVEKPKIEPAMQSKFDKQNDRIKSLRTVIKEKTLNN